MEYSAWQFIVLYIPDVADDWHEVSSMVKSLSQVNGDFWKFLSPRSYESALFWHQVAIRFEVTVPAEENMRRVFIRRELELRVFTKRQRDLSQEMDTYEMLRKEASYANDQQAYDLYVEKFSETRDELSRLNGRTNNIKNYATMTRCFILTGRKAQKRMESSTSHSTSHSTSRSSLEARSSSSLPGLPPS